VLAGENIASWPMLGASLVDRFESEVAASSKWNFEVAIHYAQGSAERFWATFTISYIRLATLHGSNGIL